MQDSFPIPHLVDEWYETKRTILNNVSVMDSNLQMTDAKETGS